VEAVLCFVAASRRRRRDTSRAAALMKILLTCFLFAPRRYGTQAFVCFLTQSKSLSARYANGRQLTSFIFFPPDFSLSLEICILLFQDHTYESKKKQCTSFGSGYNSFKFVRQLVSYFRNPLFL
jgi:hypothetical protein